MRTRTRLALLAVLSIAMSSCGAGLDPIEPGPDTGPVTAYIDGEAFVAETVNVTRQTATLVIVASAGNRSIRFEIPDNGERNYAIGQGNPIAAEVRIGAATWRADETAGEGTVTVTDWIPSYIAGSFDLRLVGGPAGTTVAVERGLFLIIGF
jgi:hypothetical protein